MPARRIAPFAVALVAFVLYLLTLNPTFGFIDKGELVATASTLGIPHPTGYPTITVLGFLFAKLMPMRDVLALNVLSALLSASGIGVLSMAFREILERLRREPRTVRAQPAPSKRARKKGETHDEVTTVAEQTPARPESELSDIVIASLAALFVGATATFWNQANGYEVYSLHALLVALVLYFFIRYVDLLVAPSRSEDDARRLKRLRILFALTLGLGFTNHLTVVLLAPGFITYYVLAWLRKRSDAGRWREAGIEILRLAPWFLAGLLPYAYLPIRAAQNPLFNWGDPDTLQRFVDHVRGKQYAVWFFQEGDVFAQQTDFFFSKLPSEVGYIGLILAALGIVRLAQRSLAFSLLVALMFVACVIWAGGYDILEIEPYFMTAVLALGIWCAAGAQWFERNVGRNAALGIAALLVILTVAINYGRANERTNLLVEDMTVNVLTTLPKDAVVISSQWDFWVAGSFYMQAAEGLRTDVAVIDQELLRRSWYLDQMATWHPELMLSVSPAVDRFRREVLKFENGEPYDPAMIQSAYIGMINAIIDSAYATRPVFVSGEVPIEMGGTYRRVPNQLMLRLMRTDAYVDQPFPSYRFRRWEDRIDHYAARAYELYARSSYARALYEAQYGRKDLARRYYEHALTFDPGWDADDVPDQALNSEDQSYGMIEFFNQIRASPPR